MFIKRLFQRHKSTLSERREPLGFQALYVALAEAEGTKRRQWRLVIIGVALASLFVAGWALASIPK